MNQSFERRIRRAVLVSLLVVALFLRLYGLNACFSNDEPLTYKAASGTFWAAATSQSYPLATIFAWLSLRFGEGEVIVRLPSLIAGMASILLIYLAGKTLYGSTAGLLAAAMLTFSPFHIEHCQSARYYSYVVCATILLLLVAHKYTASFDWRWIPAWGAVVAAGVFSHPFFLIAVAGISIAAFAFLVVSGKVEGMKRRVAGLLLFSAATAAGGGSIGFSFLARLYQLAVASGPAHTATTSSSVASIHVLGVGEYASFIGYYMENLLPFPLVVTAVFAGAGLILLFRRNAALAVGIVLAVGILPFLLHFVKVSHWYSARYFSFNLPPLAILAAGGASHAIGLIAASAQRFAASSGAAVVKWAPRLNETALAAGFVLLVALLSVPKVSAGYDRRRDDWRAVVNYLGYRVKPVDVVFLAASYYMANAAQKATRPYRSPVFEYYLDRLPRTVVPHRIVTGVTPESFLEVVKENPTGNIWVIAIESILSPDMTGLVRQFCGDALLPGSPSVYLLAEPTENLLVGGGLEDSAGIKLSKNAVIIEGTGFPGGNHAAYIHSETADQSHSVRFPVKKEEGGGNLELGAIYTLSCFIRLANVEPGSNWSRVCKVALDGKRKDRAGLWRQLIALRGTQDWTFYAFRIVPGVNMPEDVTDMGVHVGIMGGTGEVWVDNVQLERKPYPTPFVDGVRRPHNELVLSTPQ
jgi:4-amino-4-deoxy-L-arabinose transferase-like glycosyltransferase